MSDPPKPSHHDQHSPTAYAIPGYVVPSTFDPSINQPNRWINWVLINILSFIVAILTFAVLVFIAFNFIGDIFVPIDWTFDQGATLRFGILSCLIFGLLAGVAAAITALIQRAALNYQVPRWPWVIKTAIAVGGTIPMNIYLAGFVSNSFFMRDSVWLGCAIFMLVAFGPTAFVTARVQAVEVKKVATNPNQWIWISGLTWTILGSLVASSIVSFIIGVITSIGV